MRRQSSVKLAASRGDCSAPSPARGERVGVRALAKQNIRNTEKPFAPKTAHNSCMPETAHSPSMPKTVHNHFAPETPHNPFALSAAKGLTCNPSNPSPLAQGKRESTGTVGNFGWPSPSHHPVNAKDTTQPVRPERSEGSDSQPIKPFAVGSGRTEIDGHGRQLRVAFAIASSR